MKLPLMFYCIIIFNIIFVYAGIVRGSRSEFFDMSLEELLNVEVSVGTNIKGMTTKDLPSQITTISKREIKLSGARNLAELLSLIVPGFMGIYDADDFIYAFRGFAPDNNSTVMVLVNGQNANFTYNQGCSSLMALLDLSFIERIEVITGPGSATLGSGPLLGVVNIITADPEKITDNSYEVGAGYGTGQYKTLKSNFQFVGENGLKFKGSIASFEQQDGYKPESGDSDWEIPPSAIQDDKYHESSPGYSMFTFAEYKGSKISMFLTKWVWDKYTDESTNFLSMNTMGVLWNKNFILSGVSDGLSFTPEIFAKRVGMLHNSSKINPSIYYDYGEENIGTKLKIEKKAERYTGVFGLIFNSIRYGEDPFTGQNIFYAPSDWQTLWNQSDGSSVDANDGFHQFVGEKTVQNYDFFTELLYKINENNQILLSGLYSLDDISDEENFSPKISYMFKKDKMWAKIMYTEAFRTPIPVGVIELPTGGHYKHYTNPNLKTQKYKDIELHLGYDTQNVNVEVVTFYAKNKGIVMAGSFQSIAEGFDSDKYWWTFANGGNIDTYGMEASIKWHLSKKMILDASQSVVKIANADLDKSLTSELFSDLEGEHFMNYPEYITKINATYLAHDKLSFRSDLLIDYGRYRPRVLEASGSDILNYDTAVTGKDRKSDIWINLNLGMIWTPTEQLEFSVHLYNVLDSTPYQSVVHSTTNASTPYPFSFKIGLTYKF